MLLTIKTTHQPAKDLGFLLHKNPANVQHFDAWFGKIHIFYPEANDKCCSAAMLLDVDPVNLVRGKSDFALSQYVNDRPYVASSFLSVAISKVYGTAMSGRCKEKPELADEVIPLEVKISVLPCRGGEQYLRRLFEPLGYEVSAQGYQLDEKYPDWGQSSYFTVVLKRKCKLSEFLTHLYVMIPVLDDEKHYWVGEDEVDKLLKRGAGWLEAHPERDNIIARYLKHKHSLKRMALERLMDEDSQAPDKKTEINEQEELGIEEKIGLNEQRMSAVVDALKKSGAKRVLDLGCGEGKLLRLLLKEKSFEEIVGVDISIRSLEIASDRLKLERMTDKQRQRIKFLQSALTYRDRRIEGYDAAAIVEVIEHLDQPRLAAFERVIFEFSKPKTVVITTPNIEYNVLFNNLPAGKFRHKDHRFEWRRNEFSDWAGIIANRFGYSVEISPVGNEDTEVGAPTQMGIFTLNESTVRHSG